MQSNFVPHHQQSVILMARGVYDGMDVRTRRSLTWRTMFGRGESTKPRAELALACTIARRQFLPRNAALMTIVALIQWLLYVLFHGGKVLLGLSILSSCAAGALAAGWVLTTHAEKKNCQYLFQSITLPIEFPQLAAWSGYLPAVVSKRSSAEMELEPYVAVAICSGLVAGKAGGVVGILFAAISLCCFVPIVKIVRARRRSGSPILRRPRP